MAHVGKMEQKIFHAMGVINVCGIFVGCMIFVNRFVKTILNRTHMI
jgi:hypothetical protein